MGAPGVLLIIADDWSQVAGYMGNPVIETPNIDALAEQSLIFDQAFCTTPSCAASRANILSGRYSHQHGQYGHSHGFHGFRTHTHVRTLPAMLKDAGVKSGLIGKDHIAPQHVYPFDYDVRCNPWQTETLTEATADFMNLVDDQPFYLQVASLFPHRVGGGFSQDVPGGRLPKMKSYDPNDVIVPDFLPDHPDVRQDLADYYNFVTRYDDFVGRVFRELEKAGRLDDTLVMVTTDHGLPFPGAKASSFDTGHNCPLLIRSPKGQSAAQHTDALVNWTDFLPTITDFLNVPDNLIPDDLTGRSLLPIVDNPHIEGFDETYFSHCFHEVVNYYPYRVVRNRKYKYVRNLAWQLPMPIASDLYESLTWQAVLREGLPMGKRTYDQTVHHPREAFFDIDNDPMETKNLIDEPELQGQVTAMRDRLTALRHQTQDPWLMTDYQEGAVDAPCMTG